MDREPASFRTFSRCPECLYKLPTHNYKCSLKGQGNPKWILPDELNVRSGHDLAKMGNRTFTNGIEQKAIARRNFLRKAIIGSGLAGLFGAGYLLREATATPAGSTNSTVEPGSMVTPSSFIVYLDGANINYRDGTTGQNNVGSEPGAVINSIISTLQGVGGGGGSIYVKRGTYSFNTNISVNTALRGLKIIGDGDPVDGNGVYTSQSGTMFKATASFPAGQNFISLIGTNVINTASPRLQDFGVDCLNGQADGISLIGQWNALEENITVINALTHGFFNQEGSGASGQNNTLLQCTSWKSLGIGFDCEGFAQALYSCYSLNSAKTGFQIINQAAALYSCVADGDNTSNTNNSAGFVLAQPYCRLTNCLTFQGTAHGALVNIQHNNCLIIGCNLDQTGNANGDPIIIDTTGHHGNNFIGNTYTASGNATHTTWLYSGGLGTLGDPHIFLGGTVVNAASFANAGLFSNVGNGLVIKTLGGYSPQAVSGTLTAGTSPYTVPAQSYPYIFLLQAANGISAATLDGVPVPITVNQPVWVEPGHTLIITWATTAPTFKELPQ